MIAKALKLNRNFILIILIVIWLFANYFMNLNGFDKETLLIQGGCMFIVVIVTIWLVFFSEFDKGAYFFIFFILIHMLFFNKKEINPSFYVAFLFLYITVFQNLSYLAKHKSLLNSFDLGFFMAVSILFYPPFWVFGIYLFVSLLLQGGIELRNLFFAILGVFTTFLIIIEVVVIFNFWDLLYYQKKLLSFSFFEWNPSYIYIIILLAILFIGFSDYYLNINKQIARKKTYVLNIVLFLLFCLAYTAVYLGEGDYQLLIFSFPFSVIFSNYVFHKKNIITKETIIWIVIICLLFYRYNLIIETNDNLFNSISF